MYLTKIPIISYKNNIRILRIVIQHDEATRARMALIEYYYVNLMRVDIHHIQVALRECCVTNIFPHSICEYISV